MDISTWLKLATKQLKDIGITSARLDAELLLKHSENHAPISTLISTRISTLVASISPTLDLICDWSACRSPTSSDIRSFLGGNFALRLLYSCRAPRPKI